MALKYPMPDHPTPREDVAAVQRMLIGLGYRGLTQPESKAQASVAQPMVFRLRDDGIYGPVTESAVEAFQEDEGILTDGVVGSVTMGFLEEAWARRANELSSPAAGGFLVEDSRAVMGQQERLRLERVATNTPERVAKMTKREEEYAGYPHFSLRADAAEAWCRVRDIVNDHGGILTSSGGIRGLSTRVSPGRSATSMHYVGRAVDLQIYSGMVDPENDPLVITGPDPERFWTVWVRVKYKKDLGQDLELTGVSTDRVRDGSLSTSGRFINLTALFAEHGFERIRCRKSFLKGGMRIGAEFWHFQYEKGLVPGVSTFGAELKRLYPVSALEKTPPWSYRDWTFGINWN